MEQINVVFSMIACFLGGFIYAVLVYLAWRDKLFSKVYIAIKATASRKRTRSR